MSGTKSPVVEAWSYVTDDVNCPITLFTIWNADTNLQITSSSTPIDTSWIEIVQATGDNGASEVGRVRVDNNVLGSVNMFI